MTFTHCLAFFSPSWQVAGSMFRISRIRCKLWGMCWPSVLPHKAQQGSVRRKPVDREPLTVFSICPQSPPRWTQWWSRCPGCWAPGCQTHRELGPSQHCSPSSTWRRCTSPTWASPCSTSRKCTWVSGRMPGGKGMSQRGSLRLQLKCGRQRQDILAPVYVMMLGWQDVRCVTPNTK